MADKPMRRGAGREQREAVEAAEQAAYAVALNFFIIDLREAGFTEAAIHLERHWNKPPQETTIARD